MLNSEPVKQMRSGRLGGYKRDIIYQNVWDISYIFYLKKKEITSVDSGICVNILPKKWYAYHFISLSFANTLPLAKFS